MLLAVISNFQGTILTETHQDILLYSVGDSYTDVISVDIQRSDTIVHEDNIRKFCTQSII